MTLGEKKCIAAAARTASPRPQSRRRPGGHPHFLLPDMRRETVKESF